VLLRTIIERTWKKKNKRKTENDEIGLDDQRRLQQVEAESWTLVRMASLDYEHAYIGKAENQEVDEEV